MKKKMYKQQQTEVAAVNTERMMGDTITGSPKDNGNGIMEAPARRGDIID